MDEQFKIYSTLIEEFNDELKTEIINSNSCYVAWIDLNGEILFLNKAMATLFKEKSKQSLINPTFEKLLKLDQSNTLIFNGILTIGDESAINSSLNAKIFRKNGKFLIIGEVSAIQLLEQNASMHLLNQEINNLQRKLIKEKHLLQTTLNQLNQANKELNELNITKDKFFSIIAHDLRSPFNTILGFSEILSENVAKYPAEKVEQFSKIIYKSSKSAFTLLENLLTWSRLQTGRLNPKIKLMNYEKIIMDVQVLCEPAANSKNIKLEINIDTSVEVLIDEQMLQTILRNLVSNAIKFTFPNGLVKVETRNLENEVLFIVSDNGIGIEASNLGELFNIDCGLSFKGTENESGTGLGLILCKDFVEKQNGSIWVESELGLGSSFKFTIPRGM